MDRLFFVSASIAEFSLFKAVLASSFVFFISSVLYFSVLSFASFSSY